MGCGVFCDAKSGEDKRAAANKPKDQGERDAVAVIGCCQGLPVAKVGEIEAKGENAPEPKKRHPCDEGCCEHNSEFFLSWSHAFCEKRLTGSFSCAMLASWRWSEGGCLMAFFTQILGHLDSWWQGVWDNYWLLFYIVGGIAFYCGFGLLVSSLAFLLFENSLGCFFPSWGGL